MRPILKYHRARMPPEVATHQAGHARRKLPGNAQNAAKNGSASGQNSKIHEERIRRFRRIGQMEDRGRRTGR